MPAPSAAAPEAATPGAAAGAPAAAPAGAPRPASAATKPASASIEVTLSPAYGNLDLRGSRADFYHYHRPPSGFFLNRLQVTRRDRAGFPLQEFWWRNLAESDQKGYLDA